MVSIKKKIFTDSIINLIAVAIPLMVLQLLILPLMAADMSEDDYGLALTILSLLNICPSVLGNTLNNVRLVSCKRYAEINQKGDFLILLLGSAFLNVLIVSVGTIFYRQSFDGGVLVVVATSVIWLLREYFTVAYLEKLDYRGILINNILLSLGYLIGYGFFYFGGAWELVYFLGNVISLAFILITTSVWKEPFQVTLLFRKTLKDSLLLMLSGLMARVIAYADRLLLYPLLGGALVAVYYAATFFGKMISVVVGPVSNVLLSHLSRAENKSKNGFFFTLLFGFFVCVLGCIFVILISKPFIGFLYPQFVEEAMTYVPIATITAFISALSTLVNPFVLRFSPMKWQLILNTITVAVYVLLALVLLSTYGLMGFCVGVLVANLSRLILQIVVYLRMSDEQ